jgi:hypothetical protein
VWALISHGGTWTAVYGAVTTLCNALHSYELGAKVWSPIWGFFLARPGHVECSARLEGTGRRMPVPVHVPSNVKMPVPYRSYRGSRSNNTDLLRQGVPSMVPGMHGM